MSNIDRHHDPVLFTLLFIITSTGIPLVRAADGVDALLEETVVTARKREESLQDAPLAVSAYTGDSLEYRGASNIGDIAEFTPNLTFQNNPSFGGSSNAAAVYIRGVGQKEFLPTTEPGVGIYVDGVYVARSVGAILDLIDVERVEVLRGPQGTLFGRNTIGGAVSLTSKKPADLFGVKTEVKLGTDSRQDFKGSVNVPLTDNLRSSLSFASFNQDGYLTREDGVELGDDSTISGRVALNWTPVDSLEVNFSADYTEDDENGPAMSLIGISGTVLSPNTPPFATIFNVLQTLGAGGPEAPCAVGGVTTPGLPVAPDTCYDNRYVQGKDFNAGTAPAFSEAELWNANINVDWAINDVLTLKSITAVRNLDSEFARDGDHSPFTISQYFDSLDQDQFTQEFQLLGDSLGGRLQWILGAYYFQEDGDNVNLLDFVVNSFQSGGLYDNEATAFYAQASWDITDKFSATLGWRYTDETKKFTPVQVINTAPLSGNMAANPQLALFNAPQMQVGEPILPNIEKTIDIQEATPLVNLAYQFTDTLMSYVTYSEGFKSGGFTQRVFPPQVAGFIDVPAGTPDLDLIPTFDPEFVEVYEIGAKYRSADGRWTVNAALFQTTYDDMQIQVFTSVAPVTKNAGSATIEGFELELQAVPGDGWLVDFSLGYLDAAYDNIDTAVTLVDDGNDFERISDTSISAAVSKEFELNAGGTIIPRVDWSYRTEMFNDTFNTAALAQDSYSLVNANVTWLSPGESYRVALGVDNATDEEYLISGIVGDAMQSIEGLFDRGRQWYLKVGMEF
ncbi:MAG: TonB-dependent receptor [Pseudomonadales bacterium]